MTESKESDIKLTHIYTLCDAKNVKILQSIPENILEKVSALNAFQTLF